MNNCKLASLLLFAILLFSPINAMANWAQCREDCEAQRKACIADCKERNESLLCQSNCSNTGASCATQCKKNQGSQTAAKTQSKPANKNETPQKTGQSKTSSESLFGDSEQRQQQIDRLKLYQYEKWQENFKGSNN